MRTAEVCGFDILEIARILGLQYIKPGDGDELIYRCPFCMDSQRNIHKGHLYINPHKGVFWCARCGAHGDAVGLYAGKMHTDRRTAFRELVRTGHVMLEPTFSVQKCEPVGKEVSEESINYRDEVYHEFLSLLTLHPRHRADLLRRGLSEEEIARNGYKSLPDDPFARWAACRTLAKKYDLAGVPGFFRRTSQKGKPYWDCASGPGYLIPVRDHKGRIQGFQIRCDNPGLLTVYAPGEVNVSVSYADESGEVKSCSATFTVPGGGLEVPIAVPALKVGDTVQLELKCGDPLEWRVYGPAVISRGGGKYIWFSGPGAEASAVPHVANPGTKKVWVTEGPLKADVASFLLKETFVGVPGVGLWRSVKGVMAQLRPETVMVAFDADWRGNPHVAEAIRKLTEDLKMAGYRVSIADWDPALGKGIDDVAVTLQKRQTVVEKAPGGATIKKTTELTVQVSSKAAQNEGLFRRLLRLFS